MRVYQFHHLGILKKRAIAPFNGTLAKSKILGAPGRANQESGINHRGLREHGEGRGR